MPLLSSVSSVLCCSAFIHRPWVELGHMFWGLNSVEKNCYFSFCSSRKVFLLFPLCQHCARFWSKVDSLIWWKKLISNKLGLNDCREAHCAVWGALGLYKGMACVDSPCHSRKICQRRQLSAESLNWKRGLLSGKGIVLCAEGIALLKGSGRKKHGMFWGLERDLVCLWDWMAGNELADKAWA